MAPNLDLLLTFSCYNSSNSAVRLIKSLSYIEGKCLPIVTSPRMEDLSFIRDHTDNVILFQSKIANMYACRNWGFIWAYMNGIIPRYYCSMDDDIEFTPDSADILKRLDRDDYSVMTFNNGVQIYNGWKGAMRGTCKEIGWMNGDSMFTRYEDNLNYGLPDCDPNLDPLPLCNESEYQQRLCALTGRPLLADTEKRSFYIHHFRDSKEKSTLRDVRLGARIKSTMDFLRKKYEAIGIPKEVDINRFDIHTTMRSHIEAFPSQAHKHTLYNNIFVDYVDIYHMFESEYTLINGEYNGNGLSGNSREISLKSA